MGLTRSEIEFIEQKEKAVSDLMEALQKVNKYKEGDYLIAFQEKSSWGAKEGEIEPVLNSYGTPRKFKVVWVDKNGFPYVKEVNRLGKVNGYLMPTYSLPGLSFYSQYTYEIDPDYADAIILGETENFNASQVHQDKSALHKEITKYNKSIKIKTDDLRDLATYLDSLSVGDILWRSIRTSWTILEKQPIRHTLTGRIVSKADMLKVQNQKGEILNLSIWDIQHKALYSNRPRSYSEIKDPK